MCGIIGYIGNRPATEILLSGLQRLEYRGYDSAGLATINKGTLHRQRTVGSVTNLIPQIEAKPLIGNIGIAHTRWATHGEPSIVNAHPHVDFSGDIALVHNGIIENHSSIRTYLLEQGVSFNTETDTEALIQLIGFFYKEESTKENGNLLSSIRKALQEVRGTFGIIVINRNNSDNIIVARRGSPLLIGIGNNEYFIASDGSAIVEYTRQVIYVEDNEIAELSPNDLHFSTINAIPLQKNISTLEIRLEEIELSGYSHHMIKEINEQPDSLRNTLRGRLSEDNTKIKLGGLNEHKNHLTNHRRILITGCGTAWHASLVGEYLFEELVRTPTEVEYASELRYRNPIIEKNTIAILVSQSGETADTLAALREIKLKGATTFGIVNVVGSTIARETDAGIYLHVGPEIGVASTKAFTAQVTILAMLAIMLGRARQLSPERTIQLINELHAIPDKIEKILSLATHIQYITEKYVHRKNWLYLGRGVNYPVALEGALKLKEISYIHAEGLPAAEMKHGPIALIDKGMPVVVVAPRDHTYEKVIANIEEVKGRQAAVIAIATEGDKELSKLADEIIYVPKTDPILSPLVTTIPLQLIAYFAAVYSGHNVDRPRNLAKSVTVE